MNVPYIAEAVPSLVPRPSPIAQVPAVIGASLSELHTSVTTLLMHVCNYLCLFGPTTYRIRVNC